MTAVLALSIGSKVDHYGALAGVAAILGIGILAILYAAQAREVKRLREWAGRAPERDADLQQRVVDAAQRRAAVPPPPAQPVLRTQPATAAGVPATAGAVPAAIKLPGPATPAGAPAAAIGAAAAVGAAAGVAGSPTPPAPATAGVAAAGAAAAKPATAAAGASPANGPATDAPVSNGPPGTAGGAAPPPVSVPPQVVPATSAVAQPTMVVRPEAAAPPPRATPEAAAAAPLRSTAREAAASEPPAHRTRRNLAVVIFGGLAIAAIAALLITQVFNTSDSSTPAAPNRVVQPGQTAVQDPAGGGLPKLDRSKVTVSVLNGTSVQGLARGASDKLLARGYSQGIVKTKIGAAVPTTAVYYAKGSNRPARDVARILGLDVRVVAPIAPDVQALAGTAAVVVVVGLDQAQ